MQEKLTTAAKKEAMETLVPAHLWKKGQSGNPSGRPKIPDVSDLDELLRVVLGKEGASRLARKMISMAERGDRQLLMYIFDRLAGKPQQKVITERVEENPLVLVLQQAIENTRTGTPRLNSATLIEVNPQGEEGIPEESS